MEEEIVKGSISDLIFRIETLSSDRDTIKVCVRAAKELAWLESQLTSRALDAKLACPLCGGSGRYKPGFGVRVEEPVSRQ